MEIQEAFIEESKKFKPNWKDRLQNKYFLYYDHTRNCIGVGKRGYSEQATLYFKSREVLEKLIARFGKEDIKKYYLGIEK